MKSKPRPANAGPVIYVVDDDEAVRDALGMLLRSVGLEYGALSVRARFPRGL